MRSSTQFESREDRETIDDIRVEGRWVFSGNNCKIVMEQISPSPIINQYLPWNQSGRASVWNQLRQDNLLVFIFV